MYGWMQIFIDVISRRNKRGETEAAKKTRKDLLCPESLRSDSRGAAHLLK